MSRTELMNGSVLEFPDGRRYKILGLIGGGGSALLYEAKELDSELYAAIKEIYPAEGYQRVNGEIVPDGSEALCRVRASALGKRKEQLCTQEAAFGQMASRKNYQVIPIQSPVYEQANICLPDGTVYPAVTNSYARMESLTEKGITAGRYRREGKTAQGEGLPLDTAVLIMHTVLDAYAALHEDGYIHGDCQADNIFLLGNRAGEAGVFSGTAHIIDFGSARRLTDGRYTEIITDEIFSTDGYRAPELLERGADFRMSPACDVWSLGFLLLNLLTGKEDELIELGEEEMTEFLMLHPKEKLLSERQAERLGCDSAEKWMLNRILKKALANDPKERYADAGEMREALRTFDRVRKLKLSKGVTAEHLWEASIRYYKKNRQLFATEHQPGLTKELAVRRLTIYAEQEEDAEQEEGEAIPVGELLRRLAPENAQAAPKEEEWGGLEGLELDETWGEEPANANRYLQAPGGGGKSFAVSELFCEYLESGKRIPLYLDMLGFTEKLLKEAGSPERAIARMLAVQYLDTADEKICEEIESLLSEGTEVKEARETRFFLALDNLHKVSEKIYAKALAALDHADRTYKGTWILVSGREEDPQRLGSMEFGMEQLRPLSCNEPLPYVRMLRPECRIRIVPLTKEQIQSAVEQTLNRRLDWRELARLGQQYDTLKLPLFLMRYLEILAGSDRYYAKKSEDCGGDWEKDEEEASEEDEVGKEVGEEDDYEEDYDDYDEIPNSAAELLSIYFAEYEYGDTGRNIHQILEKYLPVIGYHYLISDQAVHTEQELESWVREACGNRRLLLWKFAEILDVCVRRLAILDYDGDENYRFVHDCYMDYFAGMWIAEGLQSALEEDDPRPLVRMNHAWPPRIAEIWRGLMEHTMDNDRFVRIWQPDELSRELREFLNRHRDICAGQAFWLPGNILLTVRSEYFQEETGWMELCAEFGNVEMQKLIGMCYELGFAVEKDHETAMRWLRQARGMRTALDLPEEETEYEEDGEVWKKPEPEYAEFCSHSMIRRLMEMDELWFHNWSTLIRVVMFNLHRNRKKPK
ncbi:MAG: protein kinase [Lachnospiraceae bacterium]|nr:protein kinase [Lachnospiraceae bacterium]